MFESESQEEEEREEEESIPHLHTVKNLCRGKDSSTTEPGLPWWHLLLLFGGLFVGRLYIYICFFPMLIFLGKPSLVVYANDFI